MSDGGFDEFVGKRAIDNIEMTSYCACKNSLFGPNCNQTEEQFKDGNTCENGIFDLGNSLTGCSCRDGDGKANQFHGWYCERPNRYKTELSLILRQLRFK